MRWYDVCMACPECGSKTTLQAVAYSVDGELELMFILHCPKCEELVRFIIFSSELQQVAVIKDLESDKPPSPLKLSSPLVSSPLLTRQWFKQEQNWEKEMGPSWQQKGGSNR
jgi:hypothetical protein